jgi:hypothetical protein
MAALCASIGRLLARCSGTLEKLSASERSGRRRGRSRPAPGAVRDPPGAKSLIQIK